MMMIRGRRKVCLSGCLSRRKVRSKPLFVWYAAISLMLLSVAAYWLTGQAARFAERSRGEYFSSQVKTWQSVGDEPYASYINQFAQQYGLNATLIAAMIQAESSFNPQAVSESGAYGLMQIIPGTWKQVNAVLNICRGRHAGECSIQCYQEPELNIHIGTAYFSQLVKRYNGNAVLALAAYNAGPGAVDRYGGIPAFPETQEYVERVIGNWENRIPRNEKPSIVARSNWSEAHRYAGWGLMITMFFFVIVLYGLYRHFGSWRWR